MNGTIGMDKYQPIKITKEEISQLETDSFPGRIIIVQNQQDIEKAISYLSDFPILGVDTETRPSFKKGKSYTVALIQIATEDTCFLFRINQTGFTSPLKNLFENPNIIKIGLSLKDDFSMLHKIAPFEPKGFIELQSYVKQFNIEDMSLQKIYAILFGKKISKSQRLSNWEADILTDAQKKYAATDAWACIRIYKSLSTGSFSDFYKNRVALLKETL